MQVRGGSMGWINVRAELGSDGSVHTMLRGSAETAAVLMPQAAELRQHLQEHSSTMHRVSIVQSGTVASSDQRGSGGSPSERQRGQQRGNSSSEGSYVDQELVSIPLLAAMHSGSALASTGGWLSVRA